MKILYIGHIRIPTEKAHGFQIMKMCEAFAENGHEVECIVPFRKNLLQEDPFLYYGIAPRTNFFVRKIHVGDYDLYSGGAFMVAIKDMYYSLLFLISLRRLNFTHETLVYTRNATVAWWCGVFRSDTPVVYEAHGVPRWFFVQKYLLRRVSLVVAITNGIVEDYRAQGFAGKMIVEADAYDPHVWGNMKDKKTLREELGLPSDIRIVVYTGSFSLYAWKGIDVLISTAPLLPDDVLLVLVGGSPLEILRLKQSVDSNGVLFVPRVSRAEVAKYLCSADVLVLPNKKGDMMSERYTSPLKLFEYMASGTPIVASNLPSIREVLDEEHAFLVEPNSPAALAEGIKRALTHRELAEECAHRSKEKVSEHTWQLRAKRVVDAFAF